MDKRITIGLAILSAILAVISIVLAVELSRQPRFTLVKEPFVMFDHKTAQACWSGPSEPTIGEALNQMFKNPQEEAFWKNAKSLPTVPTNPARLPFCKDLK